MLQAPTSDRKTKTDTSAKTAEHLPEQEQALQLLSGFGQSRQSQPLQQRNNLTALQKTYGNQAVLRMKGRSPVANPLQGVLQRKCACGNTASVSGTCSKCQQKQEMSSQHQAQAGEGVSEVSPIVHEVLGSPGQPLEPETRAFMESRLEHDFSQVRVHTDAKATESAKAVNAIAYTVKQSIVFDSGQYLPKTSSGRKLLAHELTHVMQQSNDVSQPQEQLKVSSPADPIELQASNIANAITGAKLPTIAPQKNDGVLARQVQKDDEVAQLNEEMSASMEESVGFNTHELEIPLTEPTIVSPARVNSSTSPGWINVDPVYILIKSGEPVELPHFLLLNEVGGKCPSGKTQWEIREGRYIDHNACVDSSLLMAASSASIKPAATAKFDISKGEFWYGSNGPISAMTQPDNPTPKGTHDIEIPDFHHDLGAKYGNFGTTWFRLGHSGDRYLHPGRVSLGCTTINQISEWPKIWEYLISARKDKQSVGELEVV
jgi:hypothetical protein